MILVKCGEEGRKISEYAIADNTFLHALVEISGIKYSGKRINFNGSDRSTGLVINTPLKNGDIVIIKKAVDNLNIRIARIGRPLSTFSVEAGKKVSDAIMVSGISVGFNEEVWVHYDGFPKGERIGLSETVQTGMILIVEPKKNTLADRVSQVIKTYTGSTFIPNGVFITSLIDTIKRG